MSYRPPAPAGSALIRWPDSFGRRFILFVDTEEEFDWTRPFAREHCSVTAVAALPAAHARFRAWGVPLALMVDHPVATDAAATDAIGPLLGHGTAMGAQLHSWVTPPFEEAPTPANSFAGRLTPALEAAKLDSITAAVTAAFGTPPRAYRAGRYGIGPATAGLLAARGYRLDSSMRPGFSYAGEGGPDFRAVPNAAFRLAGGLVEVPVTTVFIGAWRRRPALHRWAGAVPKGRGVLARAGLLSRVPLTPEGVPAAEAVRAIETAAADGERLLTLAFHSPSLVPGHTPYVRDEAGLAAFWRWWETVLAALDRLGIAPIGLDALIAACS